ncbi:MAG: hypothetical protein AAF481_07890 [Acidobacteriota bacterium]
MLYETDAGDLIDFARRWAALGDAIAEQVAQVVDDPRAAAGQGRADLEVTPNAIELACEQIGDLNEGIDAAITEYFDLLTEVKS